MTDGSRARNGFEALAEYDLPSLGGNGDGQLDSADAIWSFLLVWSDANHDGVSQPSELMTLDQAGISAIQLRYQANSRVDEFKNAFHFKGTCTRVIDGKPHQRTIYDVYFVREN